MARTDMELELLSLKFKHYTSEVRAAISHIVSRERCKDTGDMVIDGLWKMCRDDLLPILARENAGAYPGAQEHEAQISAEARELIRNYIDRARDYEAALADSEDDYFEELYRTTIGPIVRAKRDRRNGSAREKDRWDFFNKLEAEADFDRWRDKLLTPAQAVALSFGKDPEVVKPDTLKPYRPVGGSPFREAFRDRLELIEAAVATGDLPVRMSVGRFSQWAAAHGLDLPQEMTGKAAESVGEDAAFWKAKFEVAQAELNELRRGIDDLPAKSKSSIYRLILGMAIARFAHRTDQRSFATRAIREELEGIGLSLKDDAIREHLSDAAEKLDFEWRTPRLWRGARLNES